MHNYLITKATTNVSVELRIVDSTDGTPETGVVWNTSGIDLQYRRDGAVSTAITEATLAALTTAHTDGGFLHIGNGVYRFDLPDLACATGADKVVVHGTVTGMVVIGCVIQLTDIDIFDAVRAGLTSLPNAAADAAGGLPISDAGGLDLDAKVGALTFTTANQLDSNMLAISSDTTAADNLELQYDTTGLSGGTFPATQDQLGGIANVGSAIHRPADSYVLTTGTQSANLYTDTQALDATRHEHTDDAGAMDLYYEFNVGSGVPSSVQVTGYVTGNNDDVDVYGYDWVTTAWVQIGNMQGTNSVVNFVRSYDMFVNMVGAASNLGIVRVRFYKASGLTTATLAVDQIFMAFSQSSSGYENGSIWINSAASNTGTTPKIDGVATNAVSTIGAAKTLSASTNLTDFHVINGSSLTLAANSDNESYFGDNWVLALGGQSCVDIQVEGASVSGIGTAATGEMHFDGCDINTTSVQTGHFDFCGITGPVTHTLASDYNYHNCYSKIAGAASPVFNKTAGQTITVEYRNWSGGITLNGLESGDVITVGGRMGTITLNGADATVEIRGTYKAIVNNLTGSPTVNTDGAILAADVADILVDTGTTLPAALTAQDVVLAELNLGIIYSSAATGTLSTTQATSNLTGYADDQLIGRVLIVTSGDAEGEGTDITAYANATGLLTFTALTVAMANTDTFKIV